MVIGSVLDVVFFFFKQKTAYEMRISDWSSDVCSSDLSLCVVFGLAPVALVLLFGWCSFDPEVYDAAWNVSGESDAAVVFGSLSPMFCPFFVLATGAMHSGLLPAPDLNIPLAPLVRFLIALFVIFFSSLFFFIIFPQPELSSSGSSSA